MKNKNLFRKNLVARRKALGLTQEQLAVRMNVSPQSVSKWENTGYPDPELLPQLARALNTSIDVLFGMKNPESNVDLPQLIHDAIHSAKPENRSQLIMELCYAMICAYDPNGDTAEHLRQCFERETFAAVKTNLEFAMARLNPDLRYFFFLEKPENGINSYFTNPQNMARLLRTLGDEDAIHIISYLGSGLRNKMHAASVIAKRLSIPVDKVQSIIDRLDRFAAEYYDMTITVDMQSAGKPISPYIYGINQYGHQGDYNKVAVNTVRQGGNRMTAYNWETNASNAGSDWKYSSDNNLSNSSRPADCVQVLSAEGQKYDFDYKLTTLQLAGYVAADMNGTVTAEETAPSARWNKVELVKDAPFADTPDLTDGTVYMDEYVNYIIRTLGNSQSDTGIQGYSLDNEPALWGNTHSRVHPQPVTIAELTEKSVTMAAAVKKLDPNAEIFGPALYGYTAYDHLADDDATNEWETLRDANGYHWYIDCYLDQMKQASEKSGVRLLDVLDIHYYSESAREGAANRVQSVRTLHEKGFRENSWIGQWCQENVPILPTIQASIDKYYPGTKIGITEYNFGGDSDMSGAIAQAEALGCYADQGVYYATLWGGGGYIFSGMNLYTNYDGKGGSFADTLLPAVTENVAMSSAYAAINADDDSTMTVMVTNKDESTAERATIVLDGAKKQYKAAAVYAVYGDSTDIRLIDVVDVTDDTVQVTLPAYAAAMVVISDDVLDVQPDVKPEYKSETFSDPMSLVNADGYVEIPISDPEHLKKIIMTADVRSSAGSAWGNAGCALSINAVDANGMRFWTSEGYSLNLGTDSTATVEFDGTLWYDEEKIPAQIADGKVELQKWWDASEKQEQDIPDEITVTYKNVEVIYEYPAEQPVQVRSDVNADGKFNIVDVVLLQKWLLAVPDTHLANWEAGDLCEDNRLNVFDLCLMKRELINSRA